jgi:hypothetical protein
MWARRAADFATKPTAAAAGGGGGGGVGGGGVGRQGKRLHDMMSAAAECTARQQLRRYLLLTTNKSKTKLNLRQKPVDCHFIYQPILCDTLSLCHELKAVLGIPPALQTKTT